MLTEIDVQIDRRSKDVIAVAPVNRFVDRTDPVIAVRIAANPQVKQTVDAYRSAVSPLASQLIGSITAAMPNAANAACEMPAGDLIAEAQLAATQPAALGGAVMVFMDAGGVRIGNSLVSMTLPATQISIVLVACARRFNAAMCARATAAGLPA